ncbi:ORF6N domain-containing protein [Clostridium felsineum]|uniref:Uncharacterized protein n=1 Tax=Clostridium felsineum TaxID=36839 RepID=A0A1S8MDU5_9CLOT|nr:ORF6N domain-containing protein [Clostridium felsineum]URZ06428.1 hypothetical protein CLROS_017610 [Clostridium felsineum]URZ11463.1 hypothetical protein CROST_021800 [Clostridium felsineum]
MNLTPIEFKKQRVLSTELLAKVYETDMNNIQANFSRNKDHFKEGIHYYLLQGEELKQFKNQPTISQLVSKHVSQLYLWTERGANRHCKILDTDKAWEQFDNLEETYFRVKKAEPQCIEDLIIMQAQSLKDMRLQLQETKEQTTAVKQEVQAMRDVITIKPSEEWRKQTNVLIAKICMRVKDYKKPKEEIYKALQERAGCDLKIRLKNMRARLLLNGSTKSKVDKLNYLDVITEDKKLIEIYVAIVKDIAIKNSIKVKEEIQ